MQRVNKGRHFTCLPLNRTPLNIISPVDPIIFDITDKGVAKYSTSRSCTSRTTGFFKARIMEDRKIKARKMKQKRTKKVNRNNTPRTFRKH
jgi:hypothetical protein